MTNVTESRHTAAPKANTAWSNVRELSRAASAACPAPPCVARASALGLGSCHPSYCVSLSRQFLCYMLIQNFAHRERNNDRVLTRKKRLSLSANPARNRSPRKSPSCGGSSCGRFKLFNIGASHAVHLLYLNRIRGLHRQSLPYGKSARYAKAAQTCDRPWHVPQTQLPSNL